MSFIENIIYYGSVNGEGNPAEGILDKVILKAIENALINGEKK